MKAGIDKDSNKGNFGLGATAIEKAVEVRGNAVNLFDILKIDLLGKYNGANGEVGFGVKGYSILNAKATGKIMTLGGGAAISLFGYGICGTVDFNVGSIGAGIEIGAVTSIDLNFGIGAKIKIQFENSNW